MASNGGGRLQRCAYRIRPSDNRWNAPSPVTATATATAAASHRRPRRRHAVSVIHALCTYTSSAAAGSATAARHATRARHLPRDARHFAAFAVVVFAGYTADRPAAYAQAVVSTTCSRHTRPYRVTTRPSISIAFASTRKIKKKKPQRRRRVSRRSLFSYVPRARSVRSTVVRQQLNNNNSIIIRRFPRYRRV